MRVSQGREFVGEEEEALVFAAGWKGRDHAVWIDGFRIGGGGVGAAVAWMQGAHQQNPWGTESDDSTRALLAFIKIGGGDIAS